MDGFFGNARSSLGTQGESGENGKQDPSPRPDESAQPKGPQRTMDSWDEGKHPRGGNPNNTGQFSKANGSKNSLKNPRNNGKVKTSRKIDRQHREVKLPKEEYAKVVSELNTNLTEEERAKPVLQRAIGNYLYTFRNCGFNQYQFIGRRKLK